MIYAANDGGVFTSPDMGENWFEQQRDGHGPVLRHRCFAGNGKLMGGGAQDNGSLVGGVTENSRRVPARAGWRRGVDGLRPGRRDSRFRIEIRHPHFPSHGGQALVPGFLARDQPQGGGLASGSCRLRQTRPRNAWRDSGVWRISPR